jgi:hypothetical protein
MATQYAFGKIVTDGLVFAVDAADRNSYNPAENLLYYTSQIGTQMGVYYGSGSSTPLSMSLNAGIAPDGTNTATILNQTGSNVTEYIYGYNGSYVVILDPNTTYSYSIYAKSGSKDNFSFTIDEAGFGGKRYRFDYSFVTKNISTQYSNNISNNGVIIDSGSQEVGNGWVRIYGTFTTSTGSVSAMIDMIGRYGTGTGSVSVWGRQLEKKYRPTNYVQTTTNPVIGSTTWRDLSLNNNSGSFITCSYYPLNGGTIFFNNITSSVLVNSTVLQTLSGSVSLWAYPTVVTTPGYIFSAFTDGTNDRYYLNYNNGTFYCVRGNPFVGLTLAVSQPTGSWYNIAMAWDSSSMYGYFNGILIGSASYSGGSGTPSNFTIGGYRAPAGTQAFSGSIASTYIYNRTLSSSEILQNFNAQKSRFGLT